MRPIKFRAWKDKTMAYNLPNWEDVDLLHNVSILDDYGYKVMQFTGLLDKNGKEIYEGDILKFEEEGHSFFDDSETVHREVKWQTHYGAGWNFGTYHKDGEKRWSYPFWSDMEVIGDIWENPELIGKSHDS